jgi:ATP-binding cassette subfamily F protein uup
MAGVPIAALRNVRLTLGGAPLFLGVDFALARGERAALVGRNGAGKSTLMRILAGRLEADGGEIFKQPGVTSMYLAQEPDFSNHATAIDYVSEGIDPNDMWRAESQLDAWGVAYDLNLKTASGGQSRRVALARALAMQPDILLLDEPTNHLDIKAIEQLEEELAGYRGAALIVSHDRRFLETISNRVAWLRQGTVHTLEKGYREFEAWAETVEEAEERALDKLNTQLKAEERWMARGVTARRKRNMGRVRKLHEMRSEKGQRKSALNDASATASLAIDAGQQGGRLVIEAKNISKTFGDQTVIRDFSLRVMRGDRLGLVGPNGSGKTTLLKLLLGQMKPDTGTIKLATTLQIGYLDQTRMTLKPDVTLWDTLTPLGGDQVMVRGHPKHVAAYAKDFLFESNQLRQPVGKLSGGERNRLTLAIALAKPSNLLVLDEPTNDLDIETLDLLEDMLADYEGTLLLVSHDRAFLDGVVTSILTPEGEGRWLETAGGYDDYLTQKRTPAGRAVATAKAAAVSAPSAGGKPASKLTYKDQKRLEDLTAAMPKLTAEITRLEDALADSTLFTRDPKAYQSNANRLTAARHELEASELEWLALEEKREALK